MIVQNYIYTLKNGYFPRLLGYYKGCIPCWKHMKSKYVILATELILKYYPELIDIKDSKGNTLILYFSKREKGLSYMKSLWEAGADIYCQNYDGWSPLMCSVAVSHVLNTVDIIEWLLRKGCDPNERNKYGGTAVLYSVIRGNNTDVLKMLCEFRGDINVRCSEGWTVLMTVLYYYEKEKNIEIIKYILTKEELDLNIQSKDGWTALMFAIKYTNSDIISLLLRHKPRLDLKNTDGLTAMDLNREKTREKMKHMSYSLTFFEEDK